MLQAEYAARVRVENDEETRSRFKHLRHLLRRADDAAQLSRALHGDCAGFDVNSKSCDRGGRALLHEAARRGRLWCTKLLVDGFGAQVDAQCDALCTPLHYAAAGGDSELVLALLQRGADREARNTSGLTAEQVAVRAGHARTSALLAAGSVVEPAIGSGRGAAPTLARPVASPPAPPAQPALCLMLALRTVGVCLRADARRVVALGDSSRACALVAAAGERTRFTLGRSSQCDVCVAEASLSKAHACFWWGPHAAAHGSEGGAAHGVFAWHVEDAGSRHGSVVDGRQLEPGAAVALGGEHRLELGAIALSATVAPAFAIRAMLPA